MKNGATIYFRLRWTVNRFCFWNMCTWMQWGQNSFYVINVIFKFVSAFATTSEYYIRICWWNYRNKCTKTVCTRSRERLPNSGTKRFVCKYFGMCFVLVTLSGPAWGSIACRLRFDCKEIMEIFIYKVKLGQICLCFRFYYSSDALYSYISCIPEAFLRTDCSTLTVSTLSIISDPVHLILLTAFYVLKTDHQQMAKCLFSQFLLMPIIFIYFFSLKLY